MQEIIRKTINLGIFLMEKKLIYDKQVTFQFIMAKGKVRSVC